MPAIRWKLIPMAVATLLVPMPVSALAQANTSGKLNTAQAEALFAGKILPLLRERCFGCHGQDPKDIRAGLDLRSLKGMLTGGEHGPALVPGQPEKSLLYKAVLAQDLKMPPKQKDRLSAEQVGWIRDWITAGATWSDRGSGWTDPKDGIAVKTSGGLAADWTSRRYDPRDLWAFQPLLEPKVPADKGNPIDAFLAKELGKAGLKAAPRAPRAVLIRRLTLDLTGLPPTPEEVSAFVADDDPAAYDRLVDRLLASPHYGEQMARHWLDVVRYADTAGFSNDFERPHAWRYRDYVVRAFNEDRPYDRFLTEQLAGDELPGAGAEGLIAVGFLRMGPWEHTGMSVATLTRQFFLDDVTNSVGETFLGLGLSCCRCHDHKFDPLPTRDYYRMQASFAPVQFADREAPFLKAESQARFTQEKARLSAWLNDKDAIKPVLPAHASDKLKEDVDRAVFKVRKKREEFLQREKERFEPFALSVYNGPLLVRNSNVIHQPAPKLGKGKPQDVSILQGGSLEAPLDRVAPGPLSLLSAFNPGLSRFEPIGEEPEGRRLALARWLTARENPLTPRVIVNRLWQTHFGSGIFATSNNVGRMGKKPSHPELLDWLARTFVERGWSIKSLHRLVVTSQAYQRSSLPVEIEATRRLDPDNRLLAHFPMRRLAAEELRDVMLALTGELNREIGGIPNRPEIHPDVAFQPRHVMGTVAPAYQADRTPAERHRRTLYAFRIRTQRDPFLEVFDQPGADLSCERRAASTVTPQAFTLMNGQFIHARALALARRLEKEKTTRDDQIRLAFRLVFGREPGKRELELAQTHLAAMVKLHRGNQVQAATLPKVITREFVEEEIGVKFRWEERLHHYENFVSDLAPTDVGPETRALADLCLVLLNANEFLYVE